VRRAGRAHAETLSEPTTSCAVVSTKPLESVSWNNAPLDCSSLT
jgi:hypothetical protein